MKDIFKPSSYDVFEACLSCQQRIITQVTLFKENYARILCLLKIYITTYDKRQESFGEFVLNHEIFSGN